MAESTEDRHARRHAEIDKATDEEVLKYLKFRNLTQEQKDRVNDGCEQAPTEEAELGYLRSVAHAVIRGEDVPAYVPTGGEPVAASNLPEGSDPTPEHEQDDTGLDLEPTEAGPDELGSTIAAEPYADLDVEELLKLIHDEGGARAVDEIDQRTGFLSSNDTLPYLRQYALAIVEGREPPVLSPALVQEAENVAAQTARDRNAVFQDDEEVAAHQPPPPPPTAPVPLGDEEVDGVRVGHQVRVAEEDRYSDYNGHVGFVIEINTAEDGKPFRVHFGDDPTRPAKQFGRAALTVVVNA